MKHAVLVVEDNALNRELLCDWLQVEGYDTRTAEDLNAAMRELESRRFDVVLLDVQLGNEDGLSLASWIRQQSRMSALPVIAVTAHALVTDQARFLEAGCNACISKPIDFKLLANELNHWLSSKAPR